MQRALFRLSEHASRITLLETVGCRPSLCKPAYKMDTGMTLI